MSITWLAIVNPKAGHSRRASWNQRIAQRIQSEINAEVVFTRAPGHAIEIARAASTGGLAVFGGDGTIADVINGMDLDHQRLLILPGGTGNGLARDLGISSLETAFEVARSERVKKVDIISADFEAHGKRHTRLVISTASVGYAAEVVVLANRHFKSLGPWCYPLAATLQAGRQASFPITLEIDGAARKGPELITNLMVNNTRHAGNFRAFRASEINDGQMELLKACAGFWPQFFHNLAVLTKTYFYRTAQEAAVSRVEFTLPIPQTLMLDGEVWEAVGKVGFRSLPGRLMCSA